MKRALALFALVCCIALTQAAKLHHIGALNKGLLWRGVDLNAKNSAQPAEQWFQQPLDHFDHTNKLTWKQLYYVNDSFWIPGTDSPIFIILGGEGPLVPSYVQGHFITANYAAEFGALMVAVEHRFYGRSMPTSNLSTENLKFLNTEQALADFADFRDHIVKTYNASGKWIVFGGSYSGCLSAFIRLKYPHLFDGAIATSAPVKAQYDFPEYFEVVQHSIGPQCAQRVQNVTNIVTGMLATASGRVQLQKMFSTCDPITSDLDVSTFMSSLTDGIAEVVQYNNDNRASISNIPAMCKILLTGTSNQDQLQSFINWNNFYNNVTGQTCTSASYQEMINEMKDVNTQGDAAAARSWTWQTCTEYGFFQSAEGSAQPFSPTISLNWFQQQCKDIFGLTSNPDINSILNEYGGTDLQGSKIILPNGSIDPWHVLGLLEEPAGAVDETVVYIEGTAHCADLYAPRDSDLQALKDVRTLERKLIKKWISE